jgi:hypothetical protein
MQAQQWLRSSGVRQNEVGGMSEFRRAEGG